MNNGMTRFSGEVETNQEVPQMRPVGRIEFRGIMKGTIPVCDTFGVYDDCGLATVKKNGKCGVVDTEPKLVLPIEFDDVEILFGGNILALKNNKFDLYDNKGKLITKNVSFPEMKRKDKEA